LQLRKGEAEAVVALVGVAQVGSNLVEEVA
jgi:hypothetical protein